VKVMALDYGSARTGVAVSDPTGMIARPVGVVERANSEQGMQQIADLVTGEGVEQVVVGLPLTLRGRHGEQARASEQFAARLRKRVDVPVVLFDERFTTDLAQQHDAGADLDARAAAHLLSSFLQWQSGAPA
jgi:putative Holliday junction resolvase